MMTTKQIAAILSITPQAVLSRASKLGIEPDQTFGRTQVWGAGKVRKLSTKPTMGRPKVGVEIVAKKARKS